MANEAVRVEGPYQVHDFTVATGATISSLTLCALTDPRTAAASTAASTAAAPIAFAGIAATEFTAGKGKVKHGLYTKGVFNLTAGGGVTKGSLVTMSGANMITRVEDIVAFISGAVVGKAWEDIANGETGEVHVGEVI